MEMRFFLSLVVVLIAVVNSEGNFGRGTKSLFRAEAMFLSENPPSGYSGDHKEHRGGERSAKKEGQREGQRGSDHSEHRATPVKKFYLNIHDLSDSAKAYVLRPDGSITEGRLSHDEGAWSIAFDTKPMDGSMDGVFNVYVVDKQVSDGMLLIRVAKMNAINHSCGWGHKYKFDKERQRPKHLDSIPLEIVGHDLWNSYFHTQTMSGDKFVFSVLHNGKPVSASVKVRTQSGWMKMFKTDDDGKGSFQLIRDYYPEKWNDFKARKRSSFVITAEHEVDEKGMYEGKSYNRIKLVTTFTWRYQPQRSEYTSYAYGLGIAVAFAIAGGLAVYIHRERRKRPYREVRFNEKN